MRCFVSFVSVVCFLSVLVLVTSAPYFPGSASASLQIGGGSAPSSGTSSSGGGASAGGSGLTNILQQIDIPGLLRGVNSFVKLVGVFCPPLSQVLDNVIQNVTSTAFRVFGRLILQNGGLGGGSGGGAAGGGEQRVSVVLPTFPPDDEDYEDEDSDDSETKVEFESRSGNRTDSQSSTTSPVPLSIDGLHTTTESTTLAVTLTSVSKIGEDLNTGMLFTSPATQDDDANLIAKRHVRVAREAAEEEEEEDDQEGAESAPQPGEDPTNVDDDQDRDKRYLPFGGHVEAGHGGGGGSGNFLFDVIRNTADRAARTVGTVYRMVAGTESFGWGSWNPTSKTAAKSTDIVAAHSSPAFQLVAGSGATEDHDEKENSPGSGPGGVVEVDVQKGGDYHSGEGIPGPITRLFVIANRGVANLVQDLILRLAQTSERLVNFKARLITALI